MRAIVVDDKDKKEAIVEAIVLSNDWAEDYCRGATDDKGGDCCAGDGNP